jgi:hypothetical protein
MNAVGVSMRGGIAAFLLAIACVIGAVWAPAAGADPFGQLSSFGEPGTGPTQFKFGMQVAVDPSESNAVYTTDYEANFENPRLRKFSETGNLEGSAELPVGISGEDPVGGLAIDHQGGGAGKLYVLRYGEDQTTGKFVADKIEVFSTEPQSGVLVAPTSGPSTVPVPTGSDSVVVPIGLSYDATAGELEIAGENSAGNLIVERLDPTDGTVGASFEATTIGQPKLYGLAVAADGTTFVAAAGIIYRLPADLSSIAAIPGVEGIGHGTGLFPEEFFSYGAQIAVSPDGGTLFFLGGGSADATATTAGNYLVRAYSLAQHRFTLAYGNGTTSCRVTAEGAALALGSDENLFVLDHGNLQGTGQTYGAKVVRFGPGGTGCPKPDVPSTMKSGMTVEPTTIAKGDTVTLETPLGNNGALGGFSQNEAIWSIEGPETLTVGGSVVGESLAATHRFLKGGDYTIRFEPKTNAAAGNPTDTVRQLHVDSIAPRAFFNSSPASPVAGQPTTFDAGASSDPVSGALVGATYKWDFGDGTNLSTVEPTVSHTFAAVGPATVTLVVENEGLDSTPFSEAFTVLAATSGGGGGTVGVTPTPTPTPVGTPTRVPPTRPTRPKPSPLQAALAKCAKKKGKAKAECVRAAKKKFAKKPKSKAKRKKH